MILGWVVEGGMRARLPQICLKSASPLWVASVLKILTIKLFFLSDVASDSICYNARTHTQPTEYNKLNHFHISGAQTIASVDIFRSQAFCLQVGGATEVSSIYISHQFSQEETEHLSCPLPFPRFKQESTKPVFGLAFSGTKGKLLSFAVILLFSLLFHSSPMLCKFYILILSLS